MNMFRKIIIASTLCIFLSQISTAQVMMLFSSDSLTNITSPLDLDSLFYWFAADVGVTDSLGGAIATDEGVGTWNDLSGNGYHVTQTTNTARPVYKATGGPGSKPTIQFDGSNDFLASAAHFWGSDDLTIIIVLKFANATRNALEYYLAKNEGSGNTRQWALYGDVTAQAYDHVINVFKDGGTANSNRDQDPPKSTTWKVFSYTNNSGVTLYVDGSSQALTTTVGGAGDYTIYDSATPKLSIGATNVIASPTAFFQGSISEIIVYTRALTATERAAIELYLNRKYDLY